MKQLIYGRQPVRELMRANRRRVYRVLVAGDPGADVVGDILKEAQSRRVDVRRVDARELDSLCGETHHQGVAAEASEYPYVELQQIRAAAEIAAEAPLILLLDHIQDPQNTGSILRTAEAVGVHGVVIPRDRAVGVTPAVVRASSGASEHVRVALVTNLVQTMRGLKGEGVWLAGLESMPDARLYTEADLGGPLGLVVGSEGAGLGRLVRETCDFHIKLPMSGRVTSLNAGVACAVALFEVRRQRGRAFPH